MLSYVLNRNIILKLVLTTEESLLNTEKGVVGSLCRFLGFRTKKLSDSGIMKACTVIEDGEGVSPS